MAKLSGKALIDEIDRLRLYAENRMQALEEESGNENASDDVYFDLQYYNGKLAAYSEILNRIKGAF